MTIGPRTLWSARVRWAECDAQGIVFNSHYLTWADEASAVWWEAAGLPWDDLSAHGGEPQVKAAALEWYSSARLADSVVVTTSAERLGTTSLTLTSGVTVGERACCGIRTTYVWVADGAAAPWPHAIRRRLDG